MSQGYAQKLIIAQSERSSRATAATPPMGRLYLFSSYGIARKVSSLLSLTLLRSAYLRPSKLPTDFSAYSKSVLPSNRGAVNGFLPNREIAETIV